MPLSTTFSDSINDFMTADFTKMLYFDVDMPFIFSHTSGLSLETGDRSPEPLGFEHVQARQQDSAATGLLQAAIRHFLASTQPEHQTLRSSINQRFMQDTRGAPADFAFHTDEQTGILELLANADHGTLDEFCRWNYRRTREELRGEIATHMPRLARITEQRATWLADNHLLPARAIRPFIKAVRRTQCFGLYGALDSFESGHADGYVYRSTLFLSHLFEDGYHIGAPTPAFWRTGFREIGHLAFHQHFGEDAPLPRLMRLVGKMWLAHCSEVSDPSTGLPQNDVLAASARGGHQALRRLFGHVLAVEGNQIEPELIGEAWLSTREDTTQVQLVSKLEQNFAAVFPAYGPQALEAFLRQVERQDGKRTNHVQRQACIEQWAAQADLNAG